MHEQQTIGRGVSELSELQAGVKTLQIKGIALKAGQFSGSVSMVDLGDVALEVVRTSPALLIASAASGRSGRLLLLEGTRAARWDGKPVDPCDIATLQPSDMLTASLHDPCLCAFVSAESERVETLFGAVHRTRAAGQGPVQVQRSSLAAHNRLSCVIRATEGEIRSAPDAFRDDDRRQALRATLLEAIGSLFIAVKANRSSQRRTGCRNRIVPRADEFLCANPLRPIYTEDLCEALGVSASALHEAFHVAFGTSPHRYLKLRRMSLVRATLLSSAGPWRSVKAAALSFGFWHLGQFARDYRAIFGELPSATLARAMDCTRPKA
jgi:AraC family transcriptional regulator, ethanolamine operon transcriptional activator